MTPGLASDEVANAQLQIDLPRGSTSIHCDCALFVPEDPDNKGSVQGFTFPLEDGSHYNVRLGVDGMSATFHAFAVDKMDVSSGSTTVPVDGGLRAGWNRVGVDVSIASSDGDAMGSVSATFDGTVVRGPTPIALPQPPGTGAVILAVGALNPQGPSSRVEFGFDDIACSAR